MNKALVVMAAGLGSRYGGVKQIARLGPGGEILMEYGIFDALKAGFDKIIIIIKPEMLEDVKELFGDRIERSSGVRICYAFQRSDAPYDELPIPAGRTKPLGTVHAILSAKEYLDRPFAVINADDYYGQSALGVISEALDKLSDASQSTMVAYLLKNTVSRFGTVTRGVCQVDGGMLKKVDETFNIKLCDDDLIRDMSNEGGTVLDPESPVSMNLWGFHHGIVTHMDRYFRDFLAKLDDADNKSECLLPVMIDFLISGGHISTSVLSTDERWFGLTYKSDAPGVIEALQALHDDGKYPETLWK